MPSSSILELRGRQPGLLRLPSSVRLRTYGFIEASLDPDEAEIFDLNGCNQSPQSKSLLLSCRAIYDEVSRLLYSTNRFVIRYNERRSPGSPFTSHPLQRIKGLRPDTVKALRHLKIILAEASCHSLSPKPGEWEYGECCTDPNDAQLHQLNWCEQNHQHDKPLETSDLKTRALLANWDATALHLAPLLVDDTLDFAMVCDVGLGADNLQIAQSAVRSLLHLPKLKDCSVRLCKVPDPQLLQLAHDAVQKARRIMEPVPALSTSAAIGDTRNKWTSESQIFHTDAPKVGSTTTDNTVAFNTERVQHGTGSGSQQSISNPSCHLLRLPSELRLRILMYTDLITPWAEVTWSRQHNAFVASRTYCETLDFRDKECPPSRHHGCQFSECWITYPSASAGCFCRVLHSAFSTTSVCRCWAQPQALFLVCRQLYRDVQFTFFSGNRFVVHDYHSNPPYRHEALTPTAAGEYISSRLGASIFLREVIPVNCLRYLRFLELVFPPYWGDVWPSEDHPAVQEWATTLQWAQDKLNQPGLTIRLVTADPWEHGSPSRVNVTAGQGQKALAGHRRILSHLSTLRELGKFYAHLSWPWKMNNEWLDRADAVKCKEKALKEEAERLVMGARYDGLYSHGEEPLHSLWQDRFYDNEDAAF